MPYACANARAWMLGFEESRRVFAVPAPMVLSTASAIVGTLSSAGFVMPIVASRSICCCRAATIAAAPCFPKAAPSATSPNTPSARRANDGCAGCVSGVGDAARRDRPACLQSGGADGSQDLGQGRNRQDGRVRRRRRDFLRRRRGLGWTKRLTASGGRRHRARLAALTDAAQRLRPCDGCFGWTDGRLGTFERDAGALERRHVGRREAAGERSALRRQVASRLSETAEANAALGAAGANPIHAHAVASVVHASTSSVLRNATPHTK